MSKESLEHLSSLMDGEFSRETGLFLTRRLSSDDSLCECWERYHLIRDCIRQPGSKVVVTGLSVKLSASLDPGDAPQNSVSVAGRWLRPVTGLAIAASVALMAIMLTAPPAGTVTDAATETSLAASVNQPFVSPNTLPVVPVSQAASFTQPQQGSGRLNAYLLRHNQMARTAGRQGFVSFVPIVSTLSDDLSDAEKDQPETVDGKSVMDVAEK